ncbi:immunity 71 family protein [Burkholderia aenigmatica]|uniref:Imm72 family immunity protein n=1 Tax=Burkholderia aenigmatica TaxID=2015348 RepID=UPI001F3897B4|nr:Imm72 family immunity protein [Burkholderia aenigmatica]UKD11531.1 immunity 71 family protein [Burkholderia aenigmatica]
MTDTIWQDDPADRLTDDEARRKIFWLLQRVSSLSLWTRKRDAFARFSNAYEHAVNTWPDGDPEAIQDTHFPIIAEILAAYDRGLTELARGNRRVWKSDGPFEDVFWKYHRLNAYFYPNPDYWDRGGQIAPYPPKIDALAQLLHASEYQMERAPFDPGNRFGDMAKLRSANLLLSPNAYEQGFYTLAYPVFPADLPEVPQAVGRVIKTGQKVPCDGIWEPVVFEWSKRPGILPIIKRSARNDGCFNYFIRGVRAPHVRDDLRGLIIRARWRLLWEDRRYADGVVPDESQYFLEPRQVAQTSPNP